MRPWISLQILKKSEKYVNAVFEKILCANFVVLISVVRLVLGSIDIRGS